MKKLLLFVVLFGLLCPQMTSFAEENEPTIEELQQVENSSATTIQTGKVDIIQRIPKNIENTEIIESEKFDKFQNKNLTDVIRDNTSINPTYGSRGESVFKMRGFSQRQIPVLLDGVPIYIPFDGVISLDRIPAGNISEIQIIKSAPSVQYGPNSMGGVINIIQKKPEKPFELKARFNNNYVNTLGEDLYLGLSKNNFYFTLNHSFSKSHGFNMAHGFKPDPNENGGIRDNSAFHTLGLGGMAGYSTSKDQDFRINYSYLNAPWNVPPEVGIQRPRNWRFTKWRKNTLAVSLKQPVINNNFSVNGNFYYDKYFNVLDSYDDNSFTTQLMRYAFHSTYDDHSIGFNLIPEVNIGRYVKFKPIYLYKRDVHKEIPDRDQIKQIYKASTTSLGGVIELYPTEKLTFQASVAADRHKPIYNDGNILRDKIWSVSAQGGISYMITDSNKIYFNIGRKTRFPTLKELYSGFIGRNIPNPDLEQEIALSYEAGYTNKFRDISEFNVSIFRSNLKNLIVDVPVRPRVFQMQNVSKATQQGIDVSLDTHILKNKLDFYAAYSFLHAANRSNGRLNNYLEYIPKHKFFTGLRAYLPADITADLNFSYVSTVLYQDQQDLSWNKLGGYPLINFSLNKKIKEHYNVFVSIVNMLDKNYQTEANFPMPGISVIMGLKMVI
jgi:iron complex outermembrane receptor protein